jgi:hypothetical protein
VAIIWSIVFPGLRDQRSLDRKMVADGTSDPEAA